ncbi:MAG: hypothetical protein ACRC7O_11905 [Fimbriiglobus sp.]
MTTSTGWPETVMASPAGDPPRLDHEVVELPLLLPRWQAAVLEEAARTRGMTTGQMLRRVIADLFQNPPAGPGR